MICRPGDKLPDAAVINSDGDSVLLSSIFDGAPTVLFFWHLDCPACMEQAVLWNIFMEPHLRDDVKQVACLDMGSEDVAAQYSEQLQHKLIVYVDYEQLRSVYNLVLYPIIVTIDGRGKITHIQYEYSSLFDEEIVRLVTNVVVGG